MPERGGVALVTGCAGFIGSHLCERLLEEGWDVRGVDALTDYYDPQVKRRNLLGSSGYDGFAFHELDLAVAPLNELVHGVDAVFHLAGQPGVRGSFGRGFEAYVHHNVLGTQRLLEGVAARPPRAFVYASSSSVYGDAAEFPTREVDRRQPVSPYGMTKVATEELAATYLRTAAVPVVGMRYFTVYGPRQRPDMAFHRFVDAALDHRELVVFGDGGQIRDFTFVADAVSATMAAAERGVPGAVYNIGGGSPVRLSEVLGLIGEITGRELRVRHAPTARGDVRRTGADTSRARDELGFAPTWEIGRGLAEQIRHAAHERPAETVPSLAGSGSGPAAVPALVRVAAVSP